VCVSVCVCVAVSEDKHLHSKQFRRTNHKGANQGAWGVVKLMIAWAFFFRVLRKPR